MAADWIIHAMHVVCFNNLGNKNVNIKFIVQNARRVSGTNSIAHSQKYLKNTEGWIIVS